VFYCKDYIIETETGGPCTMHGRTKKLIQRFIRKRLKVPSRKKLREVD